VSSSWSILCFNIFIWVNAASIEKWRSKTYQHYNVCIVEGGLRHIQFVFKCKFDETKHKPHKRLQMKTGDGTTNLLKSALVCDALWGVATPATVATPTSYTPATHLTVITMRSATNRPFNTVTNKYYKMEVKMLRPGTVIPHPTTVSQDIKHLHVELSKMVWQYFKVGINISVTILFI
jgi:hypothetical protein